MPNNKKINEKWKGKEIQWKLLQKFKIQKFGKSVKICHDKI